MARSRFCLAPGTTGQEPTDDCSHARARRAATSLWLGLILCFAAAASTSAEPLGPSSRRTGLAISEILYNSGPRLDGRNVAFIELYNSNPWTENIGGFRLTGDISYTFPTGTVINARSFVMVAAVPANMLAAFGISGALGPYGGALPFDSGTVRLRNRSDHVLLEVEYDSRSPWPVLAAATGHSLVLARPSYGEANPAAWATSVSMGGSPRAQEPALTDPLQWMVINELVARSRAPELDYIELFNAGPQEVDLSGCVITDDPREERFVFPEGTTLGSHEYLALDEFILGFGFDAGGETIYLRSPSRTRFLDAVSFEGQAPGVAWGRSPDGALEFSELSSLTPLAPNPPPLRRDVVINEIMYAPISGNADDEYVELFNAGSAAVDLTGWDFDRGITFRFAPGTMLPAGGYLVVARKADHLRLIYPHLTLANCVGDFTGNLSKSGEQLSLRGRLTAVETNDSDVITTNSYAFPADEVTYGIGGRWGRWSHRGGSSLELIDSRGDNRLAAHWADSDETHKSVWTNATFSGTIDNANSAIGAGATVQLLLLEPGEALLDDVVARQTNGPNVVSNPGFEGGSANWGFQGSTEYSVLVPDAFAGNRALHLRAEGPGDPTVNRVISTLFPAPLTASATLGVTARWLRGSPELLVRLGGGGLEMPVSLPVPSNLGTPGLPNSRLVTNAPPVISAVAHAPILPSPMQSAVVTARVQDPDGVEEVWLDIYPSGGSAVSARMWDDGMAGDARAGDGLYSGTISPQPSGTLIGFRLRATDGLASEASFPPEPGTNRPVPQCMVRFGELRPAGSFASYHLWMNSDDYFSWLTRPPTHNGWIGGTFAYGTNRVFYNMGARYPTDPRHADAWRFGPTSPLRCDYALRFDPDEPFLGTTEAWITMPGEPSGSDTTDRSASREHLANFLLESLGLPVRPRRPVHFFVLGDQRGLISSRAGSFIMEDVAPVRPDLLAAWYDDPTGELIDIDEWAESNPAADVLNFRDARLTRATTLEGGMPVKKTAAYRWNWRRHALSPATAANGITNFFKLVDAVSPAADPNSLAITDVAALEAQADLEQWMRQMAVQHLIGNRLSYGYTRGRGLHAYRDPIGRYELVSGDVDQGFGTGDGPSASLFQAQDPRVIAMWNTSAFGRYYWQALSTLLQGPFSNAALDPILDARANALMASAIDINAAEIPAIKSWITSRRSFVFSQIPFAPFTVTPTNLTTVSNLITLSGTGPTTVYQISVNNVAYSATWTTLTNWTLRVLVPPLGGLYFLSVSGVDRNGSAVTPATSVPVTYSGPAGTASSSVIFSEIMFQHPIRRAAFLELQNTNALVSFDLSNWRVNGVEFTFPPGTFITSGQRLVLVQDRDAFAAAYGSSVPIAGVFPGELDPAGEVLTLVEPRSAGYDLVADRVHYRTTFPWPAATNGVALQLANPAGDNARPYNWRTNVILRATPGAPNSIPATLEPAVPSVWLNEAQVVHTGFPTDAAGDSDPWVELINSSNAPVSLAGLYLSDNPGNLTRWEFPTNAVIYSFSFVRVWCDGEPLEPDPDAYHASFRLQTSSPYLFLSRVVDGTPRVLDFLDLSTAGTNTYGSFIDGQPFFRYVLPSATPSSLNAPVPIFINEWMASNSRTLADPFDGDFDDWFEIYNPNDTPVDIGRFQLRDSGDESLIAGGTTIPPRGHLLVWADGEVEQNSASRADLHVDFRLGAGGDRIGLWAPAIHEPNQFFRMVDQVFFTGQNTDISEGRYPDGGQLFTSMRTATPRGPNSLPRNNSPPVFGPLPDRVVTVGQTLSFPVTVIDPDTPPQQFQFSLLPPVPLGAMIQASSGAFSWTPAADQGGLTHTVAVRVMDNGTPQLGADASFNVMVLLPPHVTGVVAEPNAILATFQLNPGHNYQVEFREELGSGAWMPLGDPFLATASTVTASLPRGPGPQRFYQVVQLD